MTEPVWEQQRRMILAAVQREQDDRDRLDDEIDALERRAAALDMKPSVPARNLIRAGLRPSHARDLVAALDAVETALGEVREIAVRG